MIPGIFFFCVIKKMFSLPTALAVRWSMNTLAVRKSTIKNIYLARIGVISSLWTATLTIQQMSKMTLGELDLAPFN